MKKEKRIPTILGLFLLIIIVFLVTSLTQNKTNTGSRASGSCEPINLQVTNLTNKSATVSFATSTDCLSNIFIANRNIENLKSKGKIHYFDINSLEESKVYTFSVISDGKDYSSDEYNFKTAQKPTNPIPESNLAWGRIYLPDKSPASEAIVYFSVPGASPLSALVTSTGDWNIALATSFNESLTNFFSAIANTEENLFIVSSDQIQTQIVGNTDRNNPVPDIIIGQNNFSAPSPAVDLPSSSLLDNEYSFSDKTDLTISNPQTNETLSTKRPDFFGTAKPGTNLKIEVHSSTAINDTTSVNSDGSWNWSPSQDLAPGEHTITITDENNNIISRKFVVLAAESSTSFTASPSATTPTKIPTPTTKITTPTPTLKPTATPTPITIPVSNPSTSSGVPQTGNTFPTVFTILLSLISVSFAFIYSKKAK